MKKSIKINDKGYLEGLDVDELKDKFYFPEADVLGFIEVIFMEFGAQVQAGKFERNPETVEPSDVVVPVVVPFWNQIIPVVEGIEAKLLAVPDRENRCAACREKNGVKCPGILKKGDLMKALIAGMLLTGFKVLAEAVVHKMEIDAKLNQVVSNYKEITGEELFEQVK